MNVRALCGEGAWAAPSALLFAADTGSVSTFGVEQVRVAGVAVPPAEVLADRLAECSMGQ